MLFCFKQKTAYEMRISDGSSDVCSSDLIVQALETAADDRRVTSVVLDLDRFLGGGQVSLAEIGAAIDTVRAAKEPVLAFATAYTTDSYQIASHASEIWADPIGGVALAGPGGSHQIGTAPGGDRGG